MSNVIGVDFLFHEKPKSSLFSLGYFYISKGYFDKVCDLKGKKTRKIVPDSEVTSQEFVRKN